MCHFPTAAGKQCVPLSPTAVAQWPDAYGLPSYSSIQVHTQDWNRETREWDHWVDSAIMLPAIMLHQSLRPHPSS